MTAAPRRLDDASRPSAAPPAAARAGAERAPLLLVRLRGSQAAMGTQHGELIRSHGSFRPSLEFYPSLPQRMLGLASTTSLAGWLTRRASRPVLELLLRSLQDRRPAPYLERSRAFLAALGSPPSDARFLQVMDVFQNLVGLAGRFHVGPFARRLANELPPACSTLVVWDGASAGGQLRHARNFDFPGISIWDRAPVVVFCQPDDGLRYGFVSTRGADTPGVTAFNEAGLSLTMHTRFHRDVSFSGAGVVDLGHDIIRRAATLDAAVRIARERRVASTWGIAVSSASERRAVVIETTASGVAVVEPRGDHLTCANRYRHPRMQQGELSLTASWGMHSDTREQRMADVVAQGRGRGGLDLADLEALLGDHVEPDDTTTLRGAGGTIAQATTVASVVFEPERRALSVSIGDCPAGWGPYLSLPWSWDGEVGAWDASSVLELGATERRGPLAGPARDAYQHFVEATRQVTSSHDYDGALVELEAAIALAPGDPAYRFLAGVLTLRRGRARAALAHFEHGLSHEVLEFRRGQLLLWGARAAERAATEVASAAPRAAAMRRELLASQHAALTEHREAARVELGHGWAGEPGSIMPNFLVVDAF